jgi:hypothetical protein
MYAVGGGDFRPLGVAEHGPSLDRLRGHCLGSVGDHSGVTIQTGSLIAMLIFMKYPLNDKRFQEIRDETEARKLAAIVAHHERPEGLRYPRPHGVS